jgi:hypothetical protein
MRGCSAAKPQPAKAVKSIKETGGMKALHDLVVEEQPDDFIGR